MIDMIIPSLWLIVLMAGLPHLSETVYAPSLPEIANALQTSHAMAEYTLTIYLLGFALGTLFWGRISDYIGRRPGVIAGLCIYAVGCIGCYHATTVTMLMASRLVQAFGGSVGSVLVQAIMRDVFKGRALSKSFALLGMSVAFFPAMGPAIGGFMTDNLGWRSIFIFLIVSALLLLCIVWYNLPETYKKVDKKAPAIMSILYKFIYDAKIIGLGFIVAATNGINFCYFAEGSFCLINVLGFSASQFGLTFLGVAGAAMLGGLTSRKLLNYYSTAQVLQIGILITVVTNSLFSVCIITNYLGYNFAKITLLIIFVIAQMVNTFCKALINANALSLALRNYRWCTGTASSLFGFYYYCLTSLFTFGMAMLHNHTLLPMPLYFLAISVCLVFAQSTIKDKLVS
ncbi:MAG: Bcr/CflA family drug resistance efflux transporter [Epsilonproteobacteria bacterium]|nr:Bcr/CflA family drug resistance efflux transporter [Campylobacterota bacterium]